MKHLQTKFELFEDIETEQYYNQKSYNKLYDAFFDFLETEGNYILENNFFNDHTMKMMDMLKVIGKKTSDNEPTFVISPTPTIKFWRFNLMIRLQFLASIDMINFLVEKIKHELIVDHGAIYVENKNFSYFLKSEDIDKVTEIIKGLNFEDYEDWKVAKKYNL